MYVFNLSCLGKEKTSTLCFCSKTLHMGKFPQDGNFACFLSLKKTLLDHCTYGKSVHQDYDSFKKLFPITGWTKVCNLYPHRLNIESSKCFVKFWSLSIPNVPQCSPKADGRTDNGFKGVRFILSNCIQNMIYE